MDEKLLLKCFEEKNHKFIISTPTTNFNVCGKTITYLKVENDFLVLKTECEDLFIPLWEIQGVQIL